jgi:4-amino-4-deoxy-L-arabinose transferase-like glycosyltransferase
MTAPLDSERGTPILREPLWYLATVALVVGAFVALVARDLPRFDWIRGYDAFAHARYVEVVAGARHLPTPAESSEWHTPPAWHVIVGALQRSVGNALDPVQQTGQWVAAACGLLAALATLALARELWPRRRALHLIALGLVAFSPAFVRASVMYHPETMAMLLATLGLLCTTRSIRPNEGKVVWAAVGAICFGFGVLTRAWVWPIALGALVVLTAGALLRAWPHGWRRFAVFVAIVAAISAPWLVHQKIEYGSAFAFNRASVSPIGSRPAAFFLGPHALDVFDRPIPPRLRNELVPQLYADWWGDFFLTWGVEKSVGSHLTLVPDDVTHIRSRQSALGLIPAILAIAGVVALSLLAASKRDHRLALVPISLSLFGLAFLWFQLTHPVPDADTIKGTYALYALPGLALANAFAADTLGRRSRIAALVLAAAAIAILALQAPFLIL